MWRLDRTGEASPRSAGRDAGGDERGGASSIRNPAATATSVAVGLRASRRDLTSSALEGRGWTSYATKRNAASTRIAGTLAGHRVALRVTGSRGCRPPGHHVPIPRQVSVAERFGPGKPGASLAIASIRIAATPLALAPGLLQTLVVDLGAVLAVALLAAIWLLIQRTWRRTLSEHAAADEALDVRWGSCGAGCGCAAGTCRREDAGERPRAPTPASSPPPTPPLSEIRR